MSFPIRSPRETVGGLFVFGRILDKIRLNAEGRLPEGYHLGIIPGGRTFDDRDDILTFFDLMDAEEGRKA
jgi:hypothetical protein